MLLQKTFRDKRVSDASEQPAVYEGTMQEFDYTNDHKDEQQIRYGSCKGLDDDYGLAYILYVKNKERD